MSTASFAVFVQVPVTVLPPLDTVASPVPSSTVSGTGLPAGSIVPEFTSRTFER